MKKKKKKQNKKNQTGLSGHKKEGKVLNPPFLAHKMNLSFSSWINDRLPEMLWAVLIIGQLERENALNFFRYIGKFVEKNPDCFDITITAISKLPDEKRKELIKYFSDYSIEVSEILRTMLLFENIPAYSDWKEFLPAINPEIDGQRIADSVLKVYSHQSQEATDCRWVKILCLVLGDKMRLPTEEHVREILEYPNFGDMKRVRPFIRASEIVKDPTVLVDFTWPTEFWNAGFEKTACIPEEVVSSKMQERQKKLSEEMENARNHYFKETVDARHKLIDHFFNIMKTSNSDTRFEGAFGLALFGLSLFVEIIFYRTPLSITGRLSLRALVETYITFKYLLLKESSEPRVWDDYRSYGLGQVKLVYLKLDEMEKKSSSIDKDYLERLANEDKWLEFVSINLGHWDNANLRQLSEDTGLKELYDRFYNYNSGFMHANWGAVRESIYQECLNPLHRFHRLPIYDLPLMPSVTDDALEIINDIFECLSVAYPEFKTRIPHV